MLTGKAKEKFKEWFYHKSDLSQCWSVHSDDTFFEEYPFSMQWGVYIEFADSLGYDLEASRFWNCLEAEFQDYKCFAGKHGEIDEDDEFTIVKSLKEAQQEAIKQLDELINKEI